MLQGTFNPCVTLDPDDILPKLGGYARNFHRVLNVRI